MRAACAGFRDETIPTRITRAMDVEKSNALPFIEGLAFDVE
jgi:hypothetical protein